MTCILSLVPVLLEKLPDSLTVRVLAAGVGSGAEVCWAVGGAVGCGVGVAAAEALSLTSGFSLTDGALRLMLLPVAHADMAAMMISTSTRLINTLVLCLSILFSVLPLRGKCFDRLYTIPPQKSIP